MIDPRTDSDCPRLHLVKTHHVQYTGEMILQMHDMSQNIGVHSLSCV